MLRRFLIVTLVLCAAPLLADAPGVYAITGGTVHPVSGPEIANGVVIIRDGLIEAVGANLPIPPDAATIDAKGQHVYPGLIDAQTSLGFPSATPQRRGRGASARTPAPTLPDTSPAFLAVREIKLTDDDVEAKRATGVTTILAAPAFGIFNGQSGILNLGAGETAERVVRDPAAQQISFNPRPAWTFPDSLMGVIADIRQTMLDAQQYSAARAIYDKNPAGYKRPPDDASLQALAPVMRREVPVVFVADSEAMMRRAEAIAKEFNIRYVLSGARQGYRFADELRRPRRAAAAADSRTSARTHHALGSAEERRHIRAGHWSRQDERLPSRNSQSDRERPLRRRRAARGDDRACAHLRR